MDPVTIFLAIFVFTLGAAIGSFLNVIIDRVPAGLPITGRSHCDYCQKELSALELIPVASFLFQRGKCSSCQCRLSWQYPLVELANGFLFLFVFVRFSSSLTFNFSLLTFNFFLVSTLLALAIIDLKTLLLPDEISLPAILISLFYILLTSSAILPTLLIAVIVALFFWLIIILTKGRGMGEGDIRLGFLIGLILGWPKTLIALYLAFFAGAIVSLVLIALKKKTLKQTVPFGPFLILGTYLMMFWGNQLQALFLKLIGF